MPARLRHRLQRFPRRDPADHRDRGVSSQKLSPPHADVRPRRGRRNAETPNAKAANRSSPASSPDLALTLSEATVTRQMHARGRAQRLSLIPLIVVDVVGYVPVDREPELHVSPVVIKMVDATLWPGVVSPTSLR